MEEKYNEIYKMHSIQIKMVNVRSSPVLVVFSAIPGSGKTELTKRLERDYGFLKIANKDIRNAIEQTGHTEDVVIGSYTLWLFDKLVEHGPRSIVFDRNIDQWYEPAKAWATKNAYKFVIVRIEVAHTKLQKRLMYREGDPEAKVFNMLDFYSDQHKKMVNEIDSTFIFKDDYDIDNAASKIAKESEP